MRELVGRAEGGIKAGGPDRLEQESKEKYLIGIKCPDRVRGRRNSTKRAAFPLAKKKEVESIREKGGKKIIENPLAFKYFFISGRVWLRQMIEGCGGRPQQHYHFFLLKGVRHTPLPVFQTEEMLPDDKLKPLIKFPFSNES